MALSPLEEFRLLKEGKLPVKKTSSTPVKKVEQAERVEAFHDNESPVDRDSRNEGTGIPHPKKPGEHCDHPADRIFTGRGPNVSIRVCGDCGGIVNDRDLQS